MGKLRGWIADLFQVEDENKVARTVFDKDGYLYQRSTKITALGTDLNKALQVDATLSNGIAAEYITDTAAHVPGTGYVFCANRQDLKSKKAYTKIYKGIKKLSGRG